MPGPLASTALGGGLEVYCILNPAVGGAFFRKPTGHQVTRCQGSGLGFPNQSSFYVPHIYLLYNYLL